METINDRCKKIAEAFHKMPPGRTGDPQAEWSYAALVPEVAKQFIEIPASVEPWPHEGQPYANSREMFADLDANNRLYVYTGGEDHPYLSRDENVMFRAIHDYYGHYLGRFQFGPMGEVNAWLAHCRMFGEEAIPAMTAETLGQNCWFNFGPFSHLPPAERPYAEQKASLLADELWRPLLVLCQDPNQ